MASLTRRPGETLKRLARPGTPRLAYAAIGVVFLIFAALAVQVYSSVKRELTDVALARRTSLTNLAAATLSERLDRMVDLAVSLGTRVRFAELVSAGQWEAAIQILRSVPSEFRFVDRVVLYDVHGTVMADAPELSGAKGENRADRDWYQGVSRGWRPYVSEVYRRGAVPQRHVFAVVVPVVDRNATPTGILQLQIHLEEFFDWAKAISLGVGSSAYVVDGKGTAAFHSSSPVKEQLINLSVTPAVARLLQGKSGVEIVADATGTVQVFAFTPAKHGWGVAMQQPASEAFAAREQQLRFMQIAYALIALSLGAVAWLGMRIGKERQRADEEQTLKVESERQVAELKRTQQSLAKHAERLRIVHEIDRAIIAEMHPESIAAAVLQPLRELLGVPRVVVNLFDLAAREVEWLAAAGRRRTHVGPGVRYSIRLMGDVEALKRGEPQRINVHELPPGPEVDALLASGVHVYMVVPMIAGGELIGALSFGGAQGEFPAEQLTIAQEVATQLAIAIAQARLFERVKQHAEELETANRQLRESERRYSDLLGNVQLLSVMLDREARITYCNEYLLRLTGWRYEEVIGRSWVELFIPPESGGLKDRLAVLFADQPEGRHGDHEILTRSGERRLIRWNNSVLRSGAGDVIGLASIGEDITERKRTEQEIRDLNASLERRVAERTQQLEASNQELESFSYSVSHDLRAPLRAVDGYARMLEEDHAARLDGEGRRLLAVVRESSRHMGQLIDDLLEFSRLGRQVPAKTRIDMTALAKDLADQMARGTRAEVALAPLPAIEADRALIRQVWTNLIGNAFKYSGKRDEPRIEIGGRGEGAENIYWVRDNGAGFDMRYAAKLFGVFQRLHGQEEFPGTGVGLAIVQRVVTRHGGRVWAEGRVGEGACFFFSLPAGA